MRKMSESKRQACKETFERVLEKYPKAFFGKDSPDTKPLKVGILNDLVEANPDLKPWILRRFLDQYAMKNRYLRATARGGFRVDLQGNPAGEVLPTHAEYAAKKLKERGVEIHG